MSDLEGARWHTSSRSGGTGDCVEVADNLPGIVGMRDSKDRNGPALSFTPAAWSVFLGAVKAGAFDPR